MDASNNYLNEYQHTHSFACPQRDVTYSCGSCGFDLNLSSSSRNTSTIGSKYGKSIKKGIISFFHIDESRFTRSEEFQCVPYFISKQSWGFFVAEPNFFAVSAAIMLEFLMTIMHHLIQLYLMDQIPPQEVNSQLIKDTMLEFAPCSLPHRQDLVFRLCDGTCKRFSYLMHNGHAALAYTCSL